MPTASEIEIRKDDGGPVSAALVPGDMEESLRIKCNGILSGAEVLIYILLGTLLTAAALVGIGGASNLLWRSLKDWTGTASVFLLMDRLLFVLMLVEILHTLRISLRSHRLVVEPFLIVGLIASIRRVLVMTLQAETLTSESHWSADGKPRFDASMIELCVLSLVIAVLIGAMFTLRRSKQMERRGA